MKTTGNIFKVTVPLLIAVAVVVASVVADRILGRLLMAEQTDLVYPAYSRAHHRSSEFDLTVRINNLGFRGPNATIAKQKKRAVFIGDSFTFGWGVEETETWIALLQTEFPDWELLNLGKGGTHPGDHVQLARKVLPLLKPDLVVVGVLQGNDLHQLMRIIAYERGERTPLFPEAGRQELRPTAMERVARRLFPNAMRRFAARADIRDRWLRESEMLRHAFSADEAMRYGQLPIGTRTAFEDGLLNPSLIFESLHFPDAYRASADTTSSLLRDATTRLRDYLLEMKVLCDAHSAELVTVSLPNRPYRCTDCLPHLLALGFDVAGCDTLDADIPFINATQQAGVLGFIVPKDSIPGQQHYFSMDGHWNADGHILFAKVLGPRLRASMNQE
jgi:hypothetical protein